MGLVLVQSVLKTLEFSLKVLVVSLIFNEDYGFFFSITLHAFVLFAYFDLDFLKKSIMLLFFVIYSMMLELTY